MAKSKKLQKIIIVALVWLTLNLLPLIFAPQLIPYSGIFAHPDKVNEFQFPQILKPLSNFDGIHYLIIATEGYLTYNAAFFPLYPLTIRYFSLITSINPFISGLLISNFCFFLLLLLLKPFSKYLKINYFWLIITIIAFPTSFFFHSIYTESLFLLLIIATFYFSIHKPLLSFLTSILAGATRINGLFLSFSKFTLGPLIGFLSFSLFQYQKYGDPFFFLHIQPSFGANRSDHLVTPFQTVFRYLKIIFTAQTNWQYFIALLELSFFVLGLVIIIYLISKQRKQPLLLSIHLFSLSNLILPSLTGTLLSMPRFSLVCLSLFFFVATLKNQYLKTFIIILFSLLHLILFSYFIQGYFVS